MPIPTPDTGSIACASADGASCPPEPVAASSLTWRPPRKDLGACTAAQVSAFLDACINASSTTAACNAYIQSDGGVRCFNCLYTDVTSTAFGPIVAGSTIELLNTGGCIALVDPCNIACAMVDEQGAVCSLASCGSACAPDASPSQQYADYLACANEATRCSCLGPHTALGACANTLSSERSLAPCYGIGASSFGSAVAAIAGLFCGNGSPDSG